MQLSQMIEGFFVVRRGRHTEQTTEGFKYCFARLTRHFGADREFEALTAADIRKYMEYLRSEGLVDRSIHDHLTRLTSLWTFAAEEFKFPNIVREVQKPSFTQKEINPFTESEVKAMLAASEWTMVWSTPKGRQVRSHRETWRRDIAMLMMMVDIGLRVTEMCKLKVSDYNQDNGRLVIRYGKGNKQRAVFLGAAAQRVLWRYIISRDRIKPSDPLFVTRMIKPLSRGYVMHLVQRIGNNAGVHNAHPHRFRHTFAIQFLRNGGNIFELQRILGHAELDTVKIYLQFAETDIERAQKANSPADNWRL
jgi:integrase/recombinase XerD